jgi:hypothetical protein
MLTVTEQAGARLIQLLAASEDQSVLRIVQRDRRMRLRRDRARPHDSTFAHAGRVVLVLDEEISNRLAAGRLDIRQTDAGPRLKLWRE